MKNLPVYTDEDSQPIAREFIAERNSLRRFLAGLTATTFGVLVTLHPHEFPSIWCACLYLASVLLNAISVVTFIISIFGRYQGLLAEGDEVDMQNAAIMSGEEYNQPKHKLAKLFKICSCVGLYSYILAILAACGYIILDIFICG